MSNSIKVNMSDLGTSFTVASKIKREREMERMTKKFWYLYNLINCSLSMNCCLINILYNKCLLTSKLSAYLRSLIWSVTLSLQITHKSSDGIFPFYNHKIIFYGYRLSRTDDRWMGRAERDSRW